MPRNPGGQISGFKLLSTPDAPTITVVTTGIGSASVAFTAPADTGDGAISSYVVTAINSSGVSTGTTGTSSPITLSLSPETFKIRMQAVNPYGPGRLTEFNTGNVVQYSGASLWAWGYNVGNLGQNDIVYRSSPVQVGALTTWAQASAGNSWVLARKTDNTLWSWGRSDQGQVGDGTVVRRSSPIQIGALTNWATVSGGGITSFAIKTDGTLWGWGAGDGGLLGDNTVVRRSSPVQIGSLTDWKIVSAQRGANGPTAGASAAIKADNTLWAWGPNQLGGIGDGTVVFRSSPVQIGSQTDWYNVSAGGGTTLALKTNNTLWTWGGNQFGQIGDNTALGKSSPIQIGALTNWSTVSSSGFSSISVKTNGTLWTWGRNNYGQLGDNTAVDKSSPIQVGALTNWSNAEIGLQFTAAIKTNGTVWAWGRNTIGGQLGDNTTVNKSSPIQIGALTNWFSASVGGFFTAALYGVV